MAFIYDLADTWNDAGTTFTAIKMDVTDTASASGSLLMDLQVGGSSKFSVSKAGNAVANTLQLSNIGTNSPAGLGLGTSASSTLAGFIGTNNIAWASSVFGVGFILPSNAGPIGFSSAASTSPSSVASSKDTLLYRDAAGVLGQRNGTNAQTFNLYGTYTDSSNLRRLVMAMSSAGVAEIKPDGLGTGASGNVLHISGLPTSNPGPGILWNDGGTVKVGT